MGEESKGVQEYKEKYKGVVPKPEPCVYVRFVLQVVVFQMRSIVLKRIQLFEGTLNSCVQSQFEFVLCASHFLVIF